MSNLIIAVAVLLVLGLGAAVLAMLAVGMIGILSGRRLIFNCPTCGRWRLNGAGDGPGTSCLHCAHPERFRWEPTLLHRPHKRG